MVTLEPLSQAGRPACSLPLADADLGLGNANWTKALQSSADWIWSGNLNPAAFPNNLARFFLQIPGVFERQLDFSTTLIFDEPSFRNGGQMSGFIERPVRELVINLIAQRRRSWYSMTHHAILGTLTARKHGISVARFSDKLLGLLNLDRSIGLYSPVEREILLFADAFATNSKVWGNDDAKRLREVLAEDNRRRYPAESAWVDRLQAARTAYRAALAESRAEDAERDGAAAAQAPVALSDEANERLVNAQMVELAFLCLQFVALTGMFTALNIPDEPFLAGVLKDVVDPRVIARINELLSSGGQDMPALIPPRVRLPVADIAAGRIEIEPAPLRGSRIPLASYETNPDQCMRDKGLAVGGIQVGVYGWSFGGYFPGNLPYCLMHHPELARFEAPYSLPLLFNEDEWRNGTQTSGFVSRRLKEVAIMRIHTLNRCRYGLEHHTMFLYNVHLDEYGVGRPPNPQMTDAQRQKAQKQATLLAGNIVLYMDNPELAPPGTFSPLDLALCEWIEAFMSTPHSAHRLEDPLRAELDARNRHEVAAGVRVLDTTPGIGAEAAYKRLLDHQIAELAMLTGHMDGLGRAMTMLGLESEGAASRADGYMTDRPEFFAVYKVLGVSVAAATANELRANPDLLDNVEDRLVREKRVKVPADQAVATAEF